MMRQALLLLGLTWASISLAQVPKKVVVEHFTNTRCGICANRNPAFFNNLDNQSGALHVAVHPSSPYSSCLFNQHNPSENDDRTSYYGIYGSTPRLVIQGEVVPASANYGNASIFNPHLNEESDFSLHIKPFITSNGDSLYTEVYIVRESASNISEASLFLAAVEALVQYNAPNGEDEHHNVFRESYLDVTGQSVTLPTDVGDSVMVSGWVSISEDWESDEMYAMAILQDDNKSVLQAESSEGITLGTIESSGDGLGYGDFELNALKLFPNPTSDRLIIESDVALQQIEVFDLLGQRVMTETANASFVQLEMHDLSSGKYLVRMIDEEGNTTMSSIIKQ